MGVSKVRYQQLGDHLKEILENVTKNIDTYISEHVIPSLPKLHPSREDGACYNINIDSDKLECGSSDLNSCVVLHNKICNCKTHRLKHLDIWGSFIRHVVEIIIPGAIDFQKTEIRTSKKMGGSYKDTFYTIIDDFGQTLKKSFIKLQNQEIINHKFPIKKLEEYKKILSQSHVNFGANRNECIKVLTNQGFSNLKKYAKQLDIPLTAENRKNKRTLSNKICSKVICK